MYAIFIWITVGISYGIISKLTDLKNSYGLTSTTFIGIVGAVVGGYIGRFVLKTIHYDYLLDINNVVMPVIGALLLIYFFNFLAKESKNQLIMSHKKRNIKIL
jgi:uncharacterized membrane protein YeaQ/YmgE (transglycosylase-associated protein family)